MEEVASRGLVTQTRHFLRPHGRLTSQPGGRFFCLAGKYNYRTQEPSPSQSGRIRSIGITRNNIVHGTTYQIQFAFNVRGVWDRYGGIYFSKNDEPISFGGRRWVNPEVYGNGWVSYGTNFYYTERIIPHWFYYEMLFSSNRTPRR